MAKYKTKLTEVEAFQYCGHLRDYWGVSEIWMVGSKLPNGQ